MWSSHELGYQGVASDAIQRGSGGTVGRTFEHSTMREIGGGHKR
jgi:hypothetical protein